MVHEMRRNKQCLKREECEALLHRATSGVLALADKEGAYAVPLSYVFWDRCLYFHCAKSGHKLECLDACASVSFCVIDQDRVVPKEYTTYYRSVIVFGDMEAVRDEREKESALSMLAHKYVPQDMEDQTYRYIEERGSACLVLRLDITHMSGKEAKQLRYTQGE